MATLFDNLSDVDPCANRHGGNAQSDAAHTKARVLKSHRHAAIMRHIASTGDHGATREEVATAMHVALHAISGRFTELLAVGFLRANGSRRRTASGCEAAVLVLNGDMPGQFKNTETGT